ncbi:hypothetical protein [Paenibacillus lignilyticus]|uniref:Uncharacterized protein n=1 Tax=Paenibacillus lignilyticus TaxID=1172615 RepID=A0ABS5CCU7_9BACL|nr:hypothetical protein [Paenibacillus lignilyticus]MBP3963821.1 hypothetical protein [Paenibacillus lignilyticus]
MLLLSRDYMYYLAHSTRHLNFSGTWYQKKHRICFLGAVPVFANTAQTGRLVNGDPLFTRPSIDDFPRPPFLIRQGQVIWSFNTGFIDYLVPAFGNIYTPVLKNSRSLFLASWDVYSSNKLYHFYSNDDGTRSHALITLTDPLTTLADGPDGTIYVGTSNEFIAYQQDGQNQISLRLLKL